MATINWSPVTAIMNNKPPGTIVTGVPGSGKTFALLNFASNALICGQRVIFIDPKNDAKVLKNVDPSTQIIDVNKIQPGALNPFTVVKNCDTNVILTVIECIIGKLDGDKMVAISPIVKDFVTKANRDKEYVDFLMLCNYLYASGNQYAREVGTALKIAEDSKYGKLLFCRDKNVEPLRIGEEPLVISLFGMELPPETKSIEQLNAEERFSSAIVYLICKILKDVLVGDSKVPTILFIDEAHMIYCNEEIASIIDSFLVLGRSLNIAVVLASQGVSHFPDDISQYVSTKIMFRMGNDEANMFLSKFDPSGGDGSSFDRNSIMSTITNAEKGQCFMIDSRNRGGFLRIVTNLGDANSITSNPLFKKRSEDEDE